MRLFLCAEAFWLVAAVPSALRENPVFIGAERCKLCHRAIYESWSKTAHARTGDSIAEPKERCAACHDTSPERRGRIECEACHGAGGNYWPAEVMIDSEKAVMAGLVYPTETTCRVCHDNDEEDHRRDFVLPPPSDWSGVIHVLPEP
ncbi:MAG TPA: cytochrome c3 family protein [Vicinamibacteria bacterium]|nr:cytochrome c3 family protein [Vicinamibacteria bacterium]